MARFGPFVVSVFSFIVTSSCTSAPPPSPFSDTIAFGDQMLTKANSWNRGGMSGIVYVLPGQQLPSASLQVGVIVSTEHTTAAALGEWIDRQYYSSGTFTAHYSGTPEESCKVGGDAKRQFAALDVCKTGVARAACVQADEQIDERSFTACLNSSCDICDRRWLMRREALDLLAADVLSRR